MGDGNHGFGNLKIEFSGANSYIDDVRITGEYSNTNVFEFPGDWDDTENWSARSLPTNSQRVMINASCVIPNGVVGQANTIAIGSGGSLTIADGGQLYLVYGEVEATIEKYIDGYNYNQGGQTVGGWNFIAAPMAVDVSSDQTNIVVGQNMCDLYRFDQTEELEWRNYKTDPFDIVRGEGYLYANGINTTVYFTGAVDSESEREIDLDYYDNTSDKYNSNSSMWGWNFLGNPFPCNATINTPGYTIQTLNGEQAILAVSRYYELTPCEGIMVKASGRNQTAEFSRVVPYSGETSAKKAGELQMTVTQNVVSVNRGSSTTTIIDNAILSFDKNTKLEKFDFFDNNAKVYIPQGGKDYAIVGAEAQGEMPINFIAYENGSYTLTFTLEGVKMGYLHLIDNITGDDVDLLKSPSYTFNANVTDYDSRFRLVFATGSLTDSEAFAFFNGSEWVIANEGEAILQVVDVMGRTLSSETVDGNAKVNVNATSGVYVIRLINGDNIKTQKVVVR